ncbi:protein kinase [Naegleria gruberi]|uniref:Protein kinase n=1 Tax=Naegleria gruberi TaxID=5762 RepID=D2VI80_NAEGR|nr:protein kinase [Naegleria gruberi]EFC43550.1 protein kinase [Naegleria gruberi]|eukprot:XP_002676294.1 protein kinase [Naegleria gruberi]
MNIHHSNILKVNDFFISKDQLLCIDMDFYELGDLVQLTKDDSTCSEQILLQIIFQMCSALDYIHSSMKLIHRDIKPSNIFVKSLDKDNIEIVIADFGLAKANQGSTNNSYAGTPLFMSPELGYGGKYFYNTDIYSLGVTIYQIITKDTFTSISQLYVTKDQKEVSQLLKKKMEEPGQYSQYIIDLTLSMLEKDSAIRPQAQDILNNSVFDQLRRRRR